MNTDLVPTLNDLRAAADRLSLYIRQTPLLFAGVDDRPLALKLEHLQLTGSFKIRGALNKLLTSNDVRQVVTASGGNHGLGVATAARLLDLPATVYVPATAPEEKIRRIKAAGARTILIGRTYAEAAEAAMGVTGPGVVYLPAYDDPAVIAGQGTVGWEIIEQAPEIDMLVVAGGGGGLGAGTAIAAGHDRRTMIVEPAGCSSVHAALAAGTPVDGPVNSIAASALGATRIGDLPLRVLQDHRAMSVLVSEREIRAARDRLWEEFRLAVEPAAAVPFAAFLAGTVPAELPCLIICGANSTWCPED